MLLRPKPIDFNSTWDKVRCTIEKVISASDVDYSIWQERFSDVYAICICPDSLSEKLYSEIRLFLESYVERIYDIIKASETNQLYTYYKYWAEYSYGADKINLLFKYLNQQHVQVQKRSEADIRYGINTADFQDQLLEIGELALRIWRDRMVGFFSDTLVPLLLKEIAKVRQEVETNKGIVYGVVSSLVFMEQYKGKKDTLQLYEEVFEVKMLEESAKFYNIKATEFLEHCSCSEYMRKVLELLINEELRSSQILHKSSCSKVSAVCKREMIENHISFLHEECKEMINKEATEDLSHMYTLLKSIPRALTHLADEYQKHIEHIGLNKVKSLSSDNQPATFVKCIIGIHDHFSEQIQRCFRKDDLFQSSLRKACTTIVNHRAQKQHCKSPELVSKYCDSLLRKGVKGMSETEVDEQLQNCITVFIYIDDKDVFQKFYSRNLAKRLIHGLSASMDAEETMINRLKSACGYDFTSKLHRMYMDVKLSGDLHKKFIDHLGKYDIGLHLNINVLQAGAWPLNSNASTFLIPQELTKCVQKFEEFYNEKLKGRKLTWLHHLGQAEVRVTSVAKTYFVTMSTYQLAILLHFNTNDEVTFGFLCKATNLGEHELEKTLSLLLDCRLLQRKDKLPKTLEMTNQTVIVYNSEFSNRRTRFKVAQMTQRDSNNESQTIHTSVTDDRKLYLQAAIVRIMKSRKLLHHNVLMEEVIKISKSRFSPSIQAIKKSIESLIEKSYLSRDLDSPDQYSYLA